ncbi:MAG: helix-turn-helix transcriptional regulator [Bryobacterales bacterium]|nr:helix-turn-helix transcriptional regulator [Bryobacterales bacterium]MBV9399293.1 helix-turn-helix transcriptional regulator [Bryobacterales bacterium]
MRLAILSMLVEGPKHGYELMKELETRSGGSYRVSAGSMYPALQMLEDEGMVTSEQRDGKRIYSLKDPGRAEVEREAAAIDRIWRKASHWGDWGPWVAGPIGGLIKATFHAVNRAGTDSEKRAKIEDILDRTRRELEGL